MSLHGWLHNFRTALAPGRGQRRHARPGSKRAPAHRPSLEVLENRLTPSFSPIASYAVSAVAVLAADFNNDTVPDFALNTGEVLLGHGDGTFGSPVNSALGYAPRAVGDLDGDGNLDLVAVDASGQGVCVLLGHGDGTFAAPSNVNVIEGFRGSVAVGDFNGDGLLDLGVMSNVYFRDGYDRYGYPFGHFEGYANVLVGTGGGAFSGPNTTWIGSGNHDPAAAADFNGDGRDDLAALCPDVGTVSVLLGDASGFLQSPTAYPTGSYYPMMVAVADVDGDLDADLVTANWSGPGGVSVLLGDGAGGFGSPQTYAPGSVNHSFVALADFNGDGKLDIATLSSTPTSSGSYTDRTNVLLGHGDGTFASAITQVLDAGSRANYLVVGDFDRDGLPDVAVQRQVWPGAQVDVLLNDGAWSPDSPSVSIRDASVTEGNTGTVNATFTLTLSHASAVAVTVHYATADITALAGSDYTATSGEVIIPAGQTSATVTVAVRGDRLPEPTETFAVSLTAATGATIGDGRGIGTILDNEPRISISDVTKAEGKRNQTTTFTFTVTLSVAYDQAVTVSFRTGDGTATTGDNDYVARTGTITFAPGQTTKTITIEVKGDSKKEANETFYLDLFGNSSNSGFTRKRGVGTILNDD
jgi:hypothetical protein